MFNFFKKKKKKEEVEKKEKLEEAKKEENASSELENDNSNSDDKTNEEFNKFNEANKNNELLESQEESIKEVEKGPETKEKQEEKPKKETDAKENNPNKLKAGRFIDLSKPGEISKETEKKTEEIKLDENDHQENKETNDENKDNLSDINAEASDNASDEADNEKESIFTRLKKGLTKTRDNFTSSLTNLFTRNVKIDDELYDELEEILISADIGMSSTIEIVDELRDEIKKRSIKESKEIYPVLKEIMINKLDEKNLDNKIKVEDGKLTVILVIGVNGVGKTTTIGKLANNFKKEGKSVMLAAADTFRAAAIDQLKEWSDRADVELVSHQEGADPSAVIFDAIKSARSKNIDVLICDTAGRLHNKKNLMQELDKINRTIDTHAVNSIRENLLVLDATTGQNAVSQSKEFKNVTDITGLILTKLDGTAKGGVIFPLQVEVEVPVKYIGVGEGIDHLQKFDSNSFVEAMF